TLLPKARSARPGVGPSVQLASPLVRAPDMDLQRTPRVLFEVTSSNELVCTPLTADSVPRAALRPAAQAKVPLPRTSLRRTCAEFEEASPRLSSQECLGDRAGPTRSEPVGRLTCPSPGQAEGKAGKAGARLPAAPASREACKSSVGGTLPKLVVGGERRCARDASVRARQRLSGYAVSL
ncbi:unnamed protein product, partial [Prorocentrum cordatum]